MSCTGFDGLAHRKLSETGIHVFRSYVNEYGTSLEMAGASLTLLKVDQELKELLRLSLATLGIDLGGQRQWQNPRDHMRLSPGEPTWVERH